MSQPVVVSFYTPEWEYSSRAELLERDCKKLNIETDIRPHESKRNWNRNTAMKPRFILECLQDHEHIIWLDCDGTLFAPPYFCLEQPEGVGITAVPHKTMATHPTTPRNWHTGLLGIKRDDTTLAFIKDWVTLCETQDMTDELGFHLTSLNYPELIEALPSNYLNVIYRNSVPLNTVYGLGISTSDDKMAMKKRNS